jgi:hypothetical protein
VVFFFFFFFFFWSDIIPFWFLKHLETNYVQFHLEIDDNQQINPFDLDYGERVLISDDTQFKPMRCFVSWCESAHIKLSTKELPVTAKYSGGLLGLTASITENTS